MTSDAWLVNKLNSDVIFRAAIYKERVEANIDGVHCNIGVVCPDSVIAYLATRAVENATELRKCVVCRIDVYALFERFIQCIETTGRIYTYVIRRPGKGVFHVIVKGTAAALHAINQLLMTCYRVVADADLETFETLTRIHAKVFC